MPGQYTSLRVTEHLALEEIRPSIGTVGDAYDSALMESINGPYKAECIRTTVFHDGPYKTLAEVEYASRRLDGLVQQPQASPDLGQRPAGRVRASALRRPRPRAAPRIGTAENLGALQRAMCHLTRKQNAGVSSRARLPTESHSPSPHPKMSIGSRQTPGPHAIARQTRHLVGRWRGSRPTHRAIYPSPCRTT
jgi:hypothetical protein